MNKIKLFTILLLLTVFNFNARSQNFQEVLGTTFSGVYFSSIAFEDIDNDNDKDILITGLKSLSPGVSELYINDGNGNFTLVTGTPFSGVYSGSIAFADIDNDNDKDVLITGVSTSKLYTNDGSGNFVEVIGTPFIGVSSSSIAFADIDNDNDQDVLITGNYGGSQRVSKLYTNDGGGSFTLVAGTPFDGVMSGSIAFCDVDNDNDQDLLITGYNLPSLYIAKLYSNDGAGNFTLVAGTPFVGVTESTVVFADVDNDNDKDVLINGTDNSNNTFAKLYINNGSGNFTLNTGPPFNGVLYGAVAFADINNDSFQDLLITGQDATNGNWVPLLYINDGTGNFAKSMANPFFDVYKGSIAFADVDSDNDQDVLITGYPSYGTMKTRLYKNNPCSSTVGTDTRVYCDSLLWIDGNTYYANNSIATYNIIGGNSNGCDSLVTLNLTIKYSGVGTDVITACNTYTWLNGNTYTTNNNTATYNFNNGSANGCDSLVTLNLTINYQMTGSFHTEWVLSGAADLPNNGYTITQDKSGNTYVAGIFRNTVDLDFGTGVINRTSNGYADIFIQKLDQDGGLIWVKTFGGAGDDQVSEIIIDDLDNLYLTGLINSADIYIYKLDSLGNFLWAKTIGGIGNDEGKSLDFDPTGNICIVGQYNGTVDFNPGSGIVNLTSTGSYDTFILKLDPNGNFIWVKSIGGTLSDAGKVVRIDNSGNIYILGQFEGTCDFNPALAINNRTSNGSFDFFVLKLDNNGSFIWVNTFGSANFDEGESLALDTFGNIIVAGTFALTVDFQGGSGIYNLSSNGGLDFFVMKMNPIGITLWAHSGGSGSFDEIQSVTTDGNSNIYAVGRFGGTVDLSGGYGSGIKTSNGGDDFFLANWDANGLFKQAISLGGNSTDDGRGVYVDDFGNTFVIGKFSNTVDFDPDTSSTNLTSINSSDIFILKFNNGAVIDEVSICSPYTWIDGNTYTASTYTPTVILNNTIGCDSVIILYLTINNLTASYNSLDNGSGNYSFTNTSTGNFNQTHWAFGDGTTSTAANPNHTFSANGTYVVVLTVNDSTSSSCMDYYLDTIVVTGVVAPLQCAAGFVMYPDAGGVTVVNSSTGTNLTYLWDFGDGDTSTLQTPSHTYAASGPYYLCLTIDDGAGCVDMYCDSIGENGVVFNKQTGFTINVIAPPLATQINEQTSITNGLSIYPNPSSGIFTIEHSKENIPFIITDISGRVITTSKLTDNKTSIDLSKVQKGVYLLKIGEQTTKLIRQ